VLNKPLTDPPTVPPRLQAITGTATVTLPLGTELPSGTMESFGDVVEARCPVADMVSRSGCDLDVKWILASEDTAPDEDNTQGEGARSGERNA